MCDVFSFVQFLGTVLAPVNAKYLTLYKYFICYVSPNKLPTTNNDMLTNSKQRVMKTIVTLNSYATYIPSFGRSLSDLLSVSAAYVDCLVDVFAPEA